MMASWLGMDGFGGYNTTNENEVSRKYELVMILYIVYASYVVTIYMSSLYFINKNITCCEQVA